MTMYDPSLSQLISQAVSRLNTDLALAAPFMAGQLSGWFEQLSGSRPPEDYFKHPLAFPSLLLPWWAETAITRPPDLAFQANLIYSTINGYYYIRLIDNLMDGHATIELKLLPALNFFHTQFQLAYQRYFAAGHPFWPHFTRIWFRSGEAAMQDAALTELDETRFTQVAAQKICAANIPLVAVCYRYDRPDLMPAWSSLVDLLGYWHQLHNDLFDWYRDHSRQNQTYFLSEAERRRQPGEPVAGWVAREGFDWAIQKLLAWLERLRQQAAQLGSEPLVAYLDTRETLLIEQKEKASAGLQSLARLAAIPGFKEGGHR
jgi:hypothetical protein